MLTQRQDDYVIGFIFNAHISSGKFYKTGEYYTAYTIADIIHYHLDLVFSSAVIMSST